MSLRCRSGGTAGYAVVVRDRERYVSQLNYLEAWTAVLTICVLVPFMWREIDTLGWTLGGLLFATAVLVIVWYHLERRDG